MSYLTTHPQLIAWVAHPTPRLLLDDLPADVEKTFLERFFDNPAWPKLERIELFQSWDMGVERTRCYCWFKF